MKKGSLVNLSRFSILPKDDPKQALRLRRFFMAGAASVLFAFLIYLSYLVGLTEWAAIAGLLIIVPTIIIIFYIVFRTGLNLKMADPSLTVIQMSVSILTVMYAMYFANEARGVLLLSYVLVFLFGIFRLDTRGFFYISIFTLLTYGINIALLHLYRPQSINFHMEYLQWVVLALILVAFSIIGGYISSLRQNLSIIKSQQAKSIEIIQEMAIRDELTGLYNRRHVMELLDYEMNRSSRGGGIFCLAMLDIDHFKNVNDNHGHQVGDSVLQKVAMVMKNTLRNVEFCGRYGGEEFLIVLTQTDIRGALICAERVRSGVESMRFPDIGPDFRVTVSLGLTEYHRDDDVQKVIARADTALYLAKHNGRNRVEFSV